MNLITDKWIEVVDCENHLVKVSIRELFEKSQTLYDISGSWTDKVSIYNLLFAIAQSALRGRITQKDNIYDLFENGYIPIILNYLDRADILPAFDFYSKNFFYNYKFTIMPKPVKKGKKEKEEKVKNWKFISQDQYASGFNHTVWDGEVNIEFSDSWKIINLLKYHLFCPGCGNNFGGKEGTSVMWNGSQIVKFSKDGRLKKTAYFDSNIFSYLRAGNLYETILFNLIPEDEIRGKNESTKIGYPIWEKKPVGKDDKQNLENAHQTFLGLKVPLFAFFDYEEGQDTIGYAPMVDTYYSIDSDKDYFINKTFVLSKDGFISFKVHDVSNPFIKDFPVIIAEAEEDGKYNTNIVKNINSLFNGEREFAKNIHSVILVSGVFFAKTGMSGCLRITERSCESEIVVNEAQNHTKHLQRKYNACISPLFGELQKSLRCIQYQLDDPFFDKKSKADKSNKKLHDNHPIKKMISLIAETFWHNLDNHHSDLIRICQINSRKELLDDPQKIEWIDIILRTFDDTLDSIVVPSSGVNLMRRALLKKQIRVFAYTTFKLDKNRKADV